MADPIVTSDIFPLDHSVTGIRSEDEENTLVIMTGSCPIPQNTEDTLGMLYRGPMNPNNSSGCNWNPTDSMGCICVLPIIDGVTATSAIFYGPDTPLFTPSIGEGNIRMVGSYRLQSGYDHGVKYEGPPDGSGTNWKKIDMLESVAGKPVANTILHSTMGNLIVGNYDLQGKELRKYNGFTYRIEPPKFQPISLTLEPGIDAELITAYGIWRNDDDSDSYTIAGGLYDPRRKINGEKRINVGYLVDYISGDFKNLKTFSYDDEPSSHITHFEGITKYGEEMTKFGPRYYTLAATGDKDDDDRGAAFAAVKRKDDGSFFEEAQWQRIYQSASSGITTGNTVLTNNLFGVYSLGNKQFQSYVASNLPVAFVKAEG